MTAAVVDGIAVEVLTAHQCGLPAAPATLKKRPAGVHLFGTTVHRTATPDPELHVVDRWRSIAHQATSGGLAEHYVYTPYNAGVGKLRPGVGVILGGRPNDVIGAHARPVADHPVPPSWADVANLYTLGVVIVGTKPTREALAALKLYLFLANYVDHAPLIVPHSFWNKTACPGDEARAWLVALHNPNVHIVDQ